MACHAILISQILPIPALISAILGCHHVLRALLYLDLTFEVPTHRRSPDSLIGALLYVRNLSRGANGSYNSIRTVRVNFKGFTTGCTLNTLGTTCINA
jgi:hypothetical protein